MQHDDNSHKILITVLMPCLNESRTVGKCIEQAHAGCRKAIAKRAEITGSTPSTGYEILIADNGSDDGSEKIAMEHDARVISVLERGYGAALRNGIAGFDKVSR